MSYSVLIVDDQIVIRHVLRFMLERAGFTVIEAEDGRQALDRVKETRPDAVILNIMMPNLDGLQTCKILRSQAATADLPIIMLSAKTTPRAIAVGLQAGADEYLTKPVDRQDLLDAVDRVLRSP